MLSEVEILRIRISKIEDVNKKYLGFIYYKIRKFWFKILKFIA